MNLTIVEETFVIQLFMEFTIIVELSVKTVITFLYNSDLV